MPSPVRAQEHITRRRQLAIVQQEMIRAYLSLQALAKHDFIIADASLKQRVQEGPRHRCAHEGQRGGSAALSMVIAAAEKQSTRATTGGSGGIKAGQKGMTAYLRASRRN